MKLIDNLLDRITMYRLVLYYLILLVSVGVVFCFLGILPFNGFSLIFSTLFLVVVSYLSHKLFARVFASHPNVESVYISSLILALIVSPAKSLQDWIFLFFAALLMTSSKYILAIFKKHIFNPVAIAVTLTSFALIGSASWWVGTLVMLPFVLLGFLIVRKIRRFDLVFYFFLTSFLTIFVFSVIHGSNMFLTLKDTLFSSCLFFFAFIMLTEPLTTPPTKKLQSLYGGLVGILFAPQFHILSFYTTPEIALVIGNIFSYIVSPKHPILTTLKEKIQVAPDMIDFVFAPMKKFSFTPGQYMEWTFTHPHTDSRGNRRYFTIASSPTEDTLRLGVRFYPNGSSYKKAIVQMNATTPIVGGQLSGDFTLPKDTTKKLVFISGGIGVTPFRSMLKYLVDMKEKRPIIQFYSNKTIDEILYKAIFDQAESILGIKTIYTLTDKQHIPANWTGKVGRIDSTMITSVVPDALQYTYYISGPHSMVVAFEETLKGMGIPEKQIKKDFFPGFA